MLGEARAEQGGAAPPHPGGMAAAKSPTYPPPAIAVRPHKRDSGKGGGRSERACTNLANFQLQRGDLPTQLQRLRLQLCGTPE